MPTWSVNPFALAQILMKEPVFADSLPALQGVLTKIFRVADLTALFDGTRDSPPALEVFSALARVVRDPETLDAVLRLPQARAVMDLIGDEGRDALASILPLVVPIADAVLGEQVPKRHYRIGHWNPVHAVTVDDASWLDPVQGAIADCYLISAMISVAWTLPVGWVHRLETAKARGSSTNALGFDFYRGPSALAAPTRVPLELPVSDGDQPLYAHSRQASEGWPGLVEKAFVRKVRKLDGEPTTADYAAIGHDKWEPQKAARLLAGGIAKFRTAVTGTAEQGLSAQVRALCDGRNVTRLPVMCWTWPNLQHADPVGWTVTGLFHGHAYAVLGTCKAGGREFVVLRNPWGGHVFANDGYAAGPWNPGPGPHGTPEVALNSNGVFGIKREWFDAAMFRVGWLEPPRADT